MSNPIPLNARQARALERISRCPSCGEWRYWRNPVDLITAELDPARCHHTTQPSERSVA